MRGLESRWSRLAGQVVFAFAGQILLGLLLALALYDWIGKQKSDSRSAEQGSEGNRHVENVTYDLVP